MPWRDDSRQSRWPTPLRRLQDLRTAATSLVTVLIGMFSGIDVLERVPKECQPWNVPGTGIARGRIGANVIQVNWTPFFEYEFIFAYYHGKTFVFADEGTRRPWESFNSSCLDDPGPVFAAAGTRRQRTFGNPSRLDDVETFFAGAWTRRARKGRD